MKLFGLVIMTSKSFDSKLKEVRTAVEKDLDDREARASKIEREHEDYWNTRAKEVQAAWKEVEEAKASLIIRELANVMGGHWRG